MKRAALILLLTIAAALGVTTPAQAGANAWYNRCDSQTYATVEVVNAGHYYYLNVNPCYRAGTDYVTALYYRLTPGWCSEDWVYSGLAARHNGAVEGPWIRIPFNETTRFYPCISKTP